MPRYSTASGSEDSDFPSQLGPASAGARQLHSTPRFQLPFNNDPNARHGGPNADGQDDSEEEGAWDEVDIPNEPGDSTNHQSTASMANGEPPEKGLEIVISRTGNTQQTKNGKRKSTALTPQERQLRQERHKVHILSLLAMGLVRNRWLNDRELQARLISQVPSHLHAALVSITREKYPNPRDRSRLFEACLKDLTSWWYQAFEIVPARELGRKAIAEIEEELNSWQEEWDRLRKKEQKAKSKGKEKEAQPLEGSRYKRFPWEEPEQLSFEKRKKRLVAQEKQQTPSASTSKSTGVPTSTPTPLVRAYNSSPRAWEPISSIATLYAAAANLRGSKDLSAQLFVALLRGLDVPARLVVSLQGMEWRSDSAAGMTKKDAAVEQKQSKSRTKGKGKAAVETIELTSSDSERDATGWEDGRGTLKYKIPKPNLRRSGPSQKKMANWQKEKLLMRSPSPDPEEVLVPPTQWPEAYSRYLKEWITLDPTRKLVRCKSKMEPTAKAKGSGNALVYVVGFEEDGSAHDVTPRYSKSYNNTTVKLRVPTSTKAKKDNGGKDWFGTILRPWERKYQLNRDKVEDEELWQRSRNEPFPTSFGGFKNHPNYVLEQHLHRDEALVEGTKALGLFKATTPVFPRSAVLVVKSTENWYRIGRSVRDGEIPRKFVKGRAVTINSKRREELIKLDGGEVDDQALFSEDQTEIYVPDPVVDGKVPKNSFGNIDLFVDTMLPEGAVHLPSKLAVKCAKLLQIDYAEAIVGFEFRQRRATPTMSGIVVAAEHADTLRRAIENLEQQTLEKTLAQQQDRVLKRWKKLIVGLRIRQRLQGQFKDVESGIVGDAANQSASTSASAVGTPRRDVSLPGSPARSDDDSISRRSAGTIGSSKRKRSSRIHRSPPPSSSLSASTDSEGPRQRSPPRKRVAPARTTRSNAATATARDQLGSELPTSVPVRTANGRPTRASALKAKQNFASQAAEESEDFDEQSEGQAEPARTVEEDVPLDRIDDWEPAETGEVGTGDRTATGNLARDLEPVKPSEELPSAAQGGEASVEVGDGHIVHIEDEYGFEYESD